jgi:2-amino-4-hydroxy-6-hydroxymethyldihydropteridine diphosphokinase
MAGLETAYIGLGSNLGDREGNLGEAVARVAAIERTKLRKVSSLYYAEPVGGPPQAWYCNAAMELETSLSPEGILGALQGIEAAMGRVRTVPDGPRIIDLDILLFGSRVIESGALVVPHPRLCARRFVLEPLAEIAAGVVHPLEGVTVAELRERIGEGQRVLRKGLSDECR